MTTQTADLSRQTIRDFGKQWTAFTANDGYYGSLELFRDIVEPLVEVEAFRGKRVADIGSGTGRVVRMLHDAGADYIVAVEPSEAIGPLRDNTRDIADHIQYVHGTGDKLPATGDLDFVVSLGVLHHIPDPAPAVTAAFRALRPGGRFFVWLYGKEGNGLYLGLVLPARRLTARLPHAALRSLSRSIEPALSGYAALCKRWPLPMAEYMHRHIRQLSKEARILTIYDQLNPSYAKYYTRHEALQLLQTGGFTDVKVHHRHGYSWSVIGTKA